MRGLYFLLASAASLAISLPAVASPDEDKARIAALEAQVKLLTDRLTALETVQGEPAPTATAQVASATSVVQTPSAKPPAEAAPVDDVPVAFASLDRALQDVGTWAEISATSDAAQVSMKIGGYFSDPGLRGRPEGWATYDSWAVTGSAPIGKTARTDIATLDGFVDSSKLKFRWTRFNVKIARPENSARGRELLALARVACAEKGSSDCDAAIVGSPFIRTWLGFQSESEYLALAFPAPLSWAYGLEGSVGYRKYSFLDPVAGVKGEKEKVPWGVKGFLSLLPRASLSSVTGALEYQRSWKEGDPIALCPPASATAFSCPVGPGGAPKLQEKLLSSLEYRRQFQIGGDDAFLKTAGFSAQFTYDWESDDWGVDVPIYLVPNDKGQMIGGLRFGYTSKDELVAGIFVGTSFSIFQ